MANKESEAIVYLVGAGPGDPDLITVKGKRLIEQCDAIVYDYLVNPILIEWTKENCEKHYVGKKGGFHLRSQEEIQALLLRLASKGKNIVRLKGGDPFIFGRGGEEASCLRKAAIQYEVVPAVTAAVAAGAYSGIPLTHRKLTSSMVFISGHTDPQKKHVDIPWESYAKLEATLCLYMSMKNLPTIIPRLLDGGMSADMPVAIVQWATTPKHKFCIGTLATIQDKIKAEKIGAPSIIIIGKVAKLGTSLNWFQPELLKYEFNPQLPC